MKPVLFLLICISIGFSCLAGSGVPKSKTGIASYYADKFEGRKTSTGYVFSNDQMTAASNHFPLNTLVKVTNLRNRKVVYLVINDRMSPRVHRLIDITSFGARQLGYHHNGLTKVKVEAMSLKYIAACVRQHIDRIVG